MTELVPLKKFHWLADKLQHASEGIPGRASLFSPLQSAMAGNPKCIQIDKFMKTALTDWCTIIHFLKYNTTYVCQLVAGIPDIICLSANGNNIVSSKIQHNLKKESSS